MSWGRIQVKDRLNAAWNAAWNKGKLLALTPYFLVSFVFIVLPFIFVLIIAFVPKYSGSNTQFTELADKTNWQIMFRSIYLGLISAFLSILIAFPYTYVVARNKSKTFRITSYALMMLPLAVFTISKTFALRGLFIKIFGSAEALQNSATMVAGMIYLYLPFMIIPLFSIMQQMPSSLLEASNDLGYSKFKTILKVVVPYCLKAIFSSIAIVFMLSATSLVINENLLQGYDKLKMIGNILDGKALYMMNPNFPLSAAQGSLWSVLTIALMMTVYGVIYFVPSIIRKLSGGVNV